MKTNVTMLRKMGEFDIEQRTQDGYFNATILLKQWNYKTGIQKRITHYLELQSTKDFIQTIDEDSLGRDHADSCKTISYIITRGNKSKGIENQVWMHPYLFMDFAMWINPKFKLTVIKFIYDQLIQFRHNAGDYYKTLNKAIAKFSGVRFQQVAKGLNYLVFDSHNADLRQNATEEQLQKLAELEKQLAFAVDMGFIKSYDELIRHMRRMWTIQHNQFAI